ncbi:hypothetical protein DEO72_LG3g1708 [Vigna unguiculata]|uniref:Uncharacterized protein n=1 Tax=Vigna unguiculata TaxID=3917 RepID=A0A4D6LG73_VIGUN|nr:hypothetical protein DEO72_LG3g1708 [Vigna unguiculata]
MPWLILSCASNIADRASAAPSAEEVPRDFLGEDDRGVLGLAAQSLRLLFFFVAAGGIMSPFWEGASAGTRLALSPPFLFSSSSFFLLSSRNTSLPEGPAAAMISTKKEISVRPNIPDASLWGDRRTYIPKGSSRGREELNTPILFLEESFVGNWSK